jgi:hypothetical protein
MELAALLGVAKAVMLAQTDVEIVYEPGVEMTLVTTKRLVWEGSPPAENVKSIPNEGRLAELVKAQPFRTYAERPPKPSDITNLMFIATAEELQETFKAAGWHPAAAMSTESVIETVRAIAEVRGYKEAPMSTLLLDGRKADFDFQKQLNTFAMRHHLRIWRRPETFEGKPVWVAAATHDIGIDFSEESRTFIHKIDSRIDRERAKVFADLVFTGKVKAVGLVARPDVPKRTENATGDKVETDGSMAVLMW